MDLIQEVEEVVQDVFINLYERANEISIHSSLSTYLHAAVRYRVYNKYRQLLQDKKNVSLIPNIEDVDYALPPVDIIGYKEMEINVHESIQKLPEKCRHAFLLSREEKLSNKQIAERLNISIPTVKKHIGKALQHLREDLSHYRISVLLLLGYLIFR